MEDLEQLMLTAAGGNMLQPSDLGRLVDEFKEVEAKRLAADRAAEKLKVQETTLKGLIINQLKSQKIQIAGGKTFACEMTSEDVPSVEDWPAFYAHIQTTGDFDLLERRPGKTACRARWEDGKEVPGVRKFPVDKLSFRRLKG